MAGEQESIAQPEVETPSAVEAELPEEPVDLNAEPAGEAPEPDGENEEPADEFEEFEWNGRQIKGPKGLKDGVLMHGDYTRKTQELSASRKELEARQARIDQQAKASEDYIELKADYRAKSRELEAYKNVDWNTWSLQDPIACQQGYIAYQNLQREAGELTQKISEADRKRGDEAQQEIAKRLHETHEYAKANIKGWSDERAHKVIEFARAHGFSNEELQASLNPATLKILHLAELGQQLWNKPAAPKIAQPAPLTVVASKSSPPAKRDIYDPNLSMDDYAAARKRGAGERRR